jgi:hypothetical protein
MRAIAAVRSPKTGKKVTARQMQQPLTPQEHVPSRKIPAKSCKIRSPSISGNAATPHDHTSSTNLLHAAQIGARRVARAGRTLVRALCPLCRARHVPRREQRASPLCRCADQGREKGSETRQVGRRSVDRRRRSRRVQRANGDCQRGGHLRVTLCLARPLACVRANKRAFSTLSLSLAPSLP